MMLIASPGECFPTVISRGANSGSAVKKDRNMSLQKLPTSGGNLRIIARLRARNDLLGSMKTEGHETIRANHASPQ
jgi:hypothetical protein